MKARIKIPAGWRRLSVGEIIRETDRVFVSDKMQWARMGLFYGGRMFDDGIAIRKIARKGGAK